MIIKKLLIYALKIFITTTLVTTNLTLAVEKLESKKQIELFQQGIALYKEGNKKVGIEKIGQAAEQGLPEAQTTLGSMYIEGRDFQKNYQEAFKLFNLAAVQGEAGGQFELGIMYLYGEGVPVDYTKAFKYIELAANQDFVAAYKALGIMFRDGKGTGQNHQEAFKYFKLVLVDREDSEVLYNIASMYGRGLGVTQSGSKSLNYLERAASAGSIHAQQALQKLRNE